MGCGGGANGSLTSFSLATSINIGVRPQKFLTFSFKSFTTFVKNVKFVPSTCHKLLKLNQDHPSKEVVFLVKSYKIDVMITSVREMTKLPNFGCMTTSAIYFV